MNTIYNERGLSDISQVREALTAVSGPLLNGRHLRLNHFHARRRIAIFLALHKSLDERGASGLARLRRREK